MDCAMDISVFVMKKIMNFLIIRFRIDRRQRQSEAKMPKLMASVVFVSLRTFQLLQIHILISWDF
jgi:hypothetical protein